MPTGVDDAVQVVLSRLLPSVGRSFGRFQGTDAPGTDLFRRSRGLDPARRFPTIARGDPGIAVPREI